MNVAVLVIGTTGFDGGSALAARSVGRLALSLERPIFFSVGAGTGVTAGMVVGEVIAAIAGVWLVGGSGTVVVGTLVVGTVATHSVGAAIWPKLEVIYPSEYLLATFTVIDPVTESESV